MIGHPASSDSNPNQYQHIIELMGYRPTYLIKRLIITHWHYPYPHYTASRVPTSSNHPIYIININNMRLSSTHSHFSTIREIHVPEPQFS